MNKEFDIDLLYAYIMTDDKGFAPNPFSGICTLACCKPAIRRSVADYALAIHKKRFKRQQGKSVNANWNYEDWGYCNIGHIEKNAGEGGIEQYIKSMNIWIVGLAGEYLAKKNGLTPKSIIYVMHLSNIVTFSDYWNNYDKKPVTAKDVFSRIKTSEELSSFAFNNTNEEYCGDNIYEFQPQEGIVKQLPSFHQIGGELNRFDFVHDLSGEYVLISNEYIYFGKNAALYSNHKELQKEFFTIRRGHKRIENRDDFFEDFKSFLADNMRSLTGKHIVGAPIQSSIKV